MDQQEDEGAVTGSGERSEALSGPCGGRRGRFFEAHSVSLSSPTFIRWVFIILLTGL